MSERLGSFVYQFGLGGLIFFASLLLLWRRGMLGGDPRARRRWVALLVAGFLLYLLGQAFFQFLAPGLTLGAALGGLG